MAEVGRHIIYAGLYLSKKFLVISVIDVPGREMIKQKRLPNSSDIIRFMSGSILREGGD